MPENRGSSPPPFGITHLPWLAVGNPDVSVLLLLIDQQQGQYAGVQISMKQIASFFGVSTKTVSRWVSAALESGHLHVRDGYRGTGATVYSVDNPSRRGQRVDRIVHSRLGRVDGTVQSGVDDSVRELDSSVYTEVDIPVASTSTPNNRIQESTTTEEPRVQVVGVHGTVVREFVKGIGLVFPEVHDVAERDVAKGLTEALAAGWSANSLADRFCSLGRPGNGIESFPGFMRGRIRFVMSRETPRIPVSRPVWCGDCNEKTRMIDVVDADRVMAARCRKCHPLLVGSAEHSGYAVASGC